LKTSKNRVSTVITTIQPPTESVCKLASRLKSVDPDANLIVVGDKKGPPAYDLAGTEFLSLTAQLDSEFDLARVLPTGHYARKNVGYLTAIRQGASCIYETDDDNAPMQNWRQRQESVAAHTIDETGWVNVFRLFTDERIWPRGFPLDEVTGSIRRSPNLSQYGIKARAPIQQGLANNSPDVDAVWRLVMDEAFEFEAGPSVYLPRGAWCPFNSQSTWWFPEAYPLMYLPSFCSFRMTDIWRSFVAQRCLWELDLGVVFHGPEVVQQRNEHDLMRDFEEEIAGYLGNKRLVAVIEGLALTRGADAVGANLFRCYEELVRAGVFAEKEADMVKVWLTDLEKAGSN
jgi:hypothetical protein